MNILIACEDLRVGGAQTFVLRLAHALSAKHNVVLYSHYHNYILWDMVRRLAPNVEIIACQIPLPIDWTIRKVDRLFYKIGIDFSIREKIIERHILKTVQAREIDIVQSNMFKSDFVVIKALSKSTVPAVITMHGNYESFLSYYRREIAGELIHNYLHKVSKILGSVKAVVYLTEKNLRIFKALENFNHFKSERIHIQKIYNGFEGSSNQGSQGVNRQQLGIPNDAFVFGMVARGIPEKGWKEAIDAFLLLKEQHPSIYLLLIGESDYLSELRQKYQEVSTIHFTGFLENPTDYLHCIDVGLLPTSNDCLPNSIIEYLYAGKPVISTSVGEISQMITYNGEQAGVIIKVQEYGGVNTEELRRAMSVYINNSDLLNAHKVLALQAFQQFNMERCISEYTSLFEKVIVCSKEN